MSFTLAALIVVACGAVVLGLIAYHLLTRVLLLERAVHGGLEPPTRRLGREEFERRFAVAAARSSLADTFDTGLVLFLGPEATSEHAVRRQLDHLARPDLVHIVLCGGLEASDSVAKFDSRPVESLDQHGIGLEALGVTTTPYAFVIDDEHVRAARPIVGANDLTELLGEFA